MKRAARRRQARGASSTQGIRGGRSPASLIPEALESRVFLSGSVLASVVKGNLNIRGDAASNDIVMDHAGLNADQVRVSGTGGTAVNGQAEPVVLSGVTHRAFVRMGGGTDSVTLSGLNMADDLSIDAERVALRSVQVGRNTRIVNNYAPALMTIDDSHFRGSVRLHTAKGADVVQIESNGDAAGPATAFDGKLLVSLGAGDDILQVGVAGQDGNHSVLGGRVRLGGGKGTDTLRNFDTSTHPANSRFGIRNFESNTLSADAVAPAVSSTDPANNATGVAINKKVAATFSEVMDPTTITPATVTVTGPGSAPVAGTVAYTGTTMTFTPASLLAADTTYTATITTGAKDPAGNALAGNFVWTFTTGATADTTAPVVSSTDPVTGATGVALNKKIAAAFSEAMDPLTVGGSSFTLTGPGSAAVPGAVTYVGTTVTFTPAANLEPNTAYTATVTTGATDLAGNPLAADHTWTFTTGITADTTAPAVTATDPANNATGVALNKKVVASFSESMDPLTITAANVTLSAPGPVAVVGTVSYVGTTMTFTPNSPLAPNTTFIATITTSAKDLAGNALADYFVWTFTTGAAPDTTAPTVIATNPADLQTNVALNKTVAATFSESMDPLTVNAATVTLTGPGNTAVVGAVTYDAPGRTATFAPSSNLAPNTAYTATIKGGINGVKDLAGNPLSGDMVWTFTTGTQVAQAPIQLGRAGPFAVMATASISGTGPTQINGDVGLNPGSAQGIPPAQVNGTIHVNDQAIVDAQSDLLAAYNDTVGRSVTAVNLPGNMGGLTFTPGLYTNSTSVLIQGAGPENNVTLDAQGDPNAIFIFQMGSTLTTGPGAQVILAGGAKAGNVFWQVGTSATLNTTTIFKGNILASVSIIVNAGSAVEGRLLGGSNSDGSVTVNGSTVTVPAV